MTEQCPDLNRECFYVHENLQYTSSKKGITYLSAFLEFVFFHIFYFQCLVKHLLKTVLASVWLHRFLEFRGIEIQKIAFVKVNEYILMRKQNSLQGHLTQIWNSIRNFPYIWGIFWGIPYKYPVLWETSKYLKISHLRISILIWELWGIPRIPLNLGNSPNFRESWIFCNFFEDSESGLFFVEIGHAREEGKANHTRIAFISQFTHKQRVAATRSPIVLPSRTPISSGKMACDFILKYNIKYMPADVDLL